MIAVVTQAGFKEGMGHVMRMLCLLNELKDELKVDATFILKKKDEVVFNFIKDRGFDVVARNAVDVMEKIVPNAVFFDKFDVEKELAVKAKEFGKVVMFDSTTSNEFADVVVNTLVKCKCYRSCYCGLKYLVLRKEFSNFWKMKKKVKNDVEKILLMFGGSDPSNFTAKILNLVGEFDTNFDVTVVLGPKYKYLNEVKRIAEGLEAQVLINPNNIPELMFESDVVVTSLGLTTFEAMCVGTPVIAICQNDLQRWLKSQMPYLKFIISRFTEFKFVEIFKKMMDFNLRKSLSDYGKSLCDGKGLFRVVELIQNVW